MKKLILLWTLLLITCGSVMSSDKYYYYQGERVPLSVNTDSVTIYAALTNRRITEPSNSIIISTVPIEMVKQLSVQENVDILSVEYLIGDSKHCIFPPR